MSAPEDIRFIRENMEKLNVDDLRKLLEKIDAVLAFDAKNMAKAPEVPSEPENLEPMDY